MFPSYWVEFLYNCIKGLAKKNNWNVNVFTPSMYLINRSRECKKLWTKIPCSAATTPTTMWTKPSRLFRISRRGMRSSHSQPLLLNAQEHHRRSCIWHMTTSERYVSFLDFNLLPVLRNPFGLTEDRTCSKVSFPRLAAFFFNDPCYEGIWHRIYYLYILLLSEQMFTPVIIFQDYQWLQ